MIPPTLVLSVLFLCGLEQTVLSHHGHCTSNQCFVVFQELGNFHGAQKSCNDSGGQLLVYSREKVEKTLKNQPSGRYWLGLQNITGSPANCSSVNVSVEQDFMLLPEPCHNPLNGFLCQYRFHEPCSDLQAGGGFQVNYTAMMGFEVDESSEVFPPATIALVGMVGGKHPDSKHVCHSSTWVRAPWTCGVLKGGCEHNCSLATDKTHVCTCPAGRILHPNGITCIDNPCEVNPCTGEGKKCVVVQGGLIRCECKDGFVEEDGLCVDVSICEKCEHMMCKKSDGVYGCACQEGFMVASHDPTKCELICTERQCPAKCVGHQCYCQNGYIQEANNSNIFCTDIDECELDFCDHKCENLPGSYRCLCNEGFKLHHDGYTCELIREEEEKEKKEEEEEEEEEEEKQQAEGSNSAPQTGCVPGIVFMVLCVVLLFFVIRNPLPSWCPQQDFS